MKRRWIFLSALLLALLSFPAQWYPLPMRLKLDDWFGAADYQGLPQSLQTAPVNAETFCPPDPQGWRKATSIEGVDVRASAPCVADNPYSVAAFVRGTNNIKADTLLKSGLAADAVEKGRDLDGDGDPDEIHIRLEVAELEGDLLKAIIAGDIDKIRNEYAKLTAARVAFAQTEMAQLGG